VGTMEQEKLTESQRCKYSCGKDRAHDVFRCD
jgi:hypothetical protein